MESKKVNFISKLSFISLAVTVLLSVFFFIPYSSVTLDASKGFLVSIGSTLSIFFWLIARLVDGKFVIAKDRIMLAVFAIPFMFLVASFFSSSLYSSLFGSGFEVGTFGFVLNMSILFFLSASYFQTENNLKLFFKYLFIATGVLLLMQLVYLILGVFSVNTRFFMGITSGNFVGSWNDFASFLGIMMILSIFTLEFLNLTKKYRIFLYVLIGLSLVFLMIVNIPFIWFMVGLFSLIVFVYGISMQSIKNKENESDRKISVPALIVMIVAVLFLIGGNLFGGLISRYINFNNQDIRPSLQATANIAWHSIKHNPFFGTGPNTFDLDWSLWKPQVIKDTAYWNVDFNNGVGFVPTTLATTGILGFLSIIFFMFLFFVKGIKALNFAFKNNTSNYFLVASLILSVYGWVTLVFYNPGIFISTLTFVSSGIFIGVLILGKNISVYNISFLNDPRHSFFSILSIVLLMIVSVAGIYMYTQKFVSVVFYSKALNVSGTSLESLAKSETMLLNAIALDKNDTYYKALSQVYVAELNTLLSDKTLSQDIIKSRAQTIVSNLQQSASLAVSQSPKNYQNWVNLGNVHSALVPMGVEKAYENAVEAYDKALVYAPSNPSILLARAQLEFLKKDNASAKKYINEALAMKKDYLDAIFTMAQIQTSEGDLPGAIKQAEYASSMYPNDPSVFFQLGLLRYNNNDFGGAIGAFENAVILNPSYYNARYFLGLSYSKAGRSNDAKVQFEILNKYIPNNPDVKKELDKLSNPVSAVETKTDNKKNTTKNVKLPIPEKR